MVSDVVIVAAITGFVTIITITVPSYLIYKTKVKVDLTSEKVDDVSHRIDGRLDQLLELSKKSSFAAGVKHEKDTPSSPQ